MVRAKLNESRRWRAIAVLGGLEVLHPFHELLGWRGLDEAAFRAAARATLKEPRSALALDARRLLLDRLEDAPETTEQLVAWERDAFIDLPYDDAQADAWLAFFRRGWDEVTAPSEDEPDDEEDEVYMETAVRRAFAFVVAELEGNPAYALADQMRKLPLSREDVFIYAREGMDHDDPCCDDPLVRVVRQVEHETLRRAAASLADDIDENTREDLRELAEEWLDAQSATYPKPLMPFAHLAHPRHARPPFDPERWPWP